MWILPLLGYLGLLLGFLFLTLAIASGLYYLSELVEEHTVLSKKLLYRLIYGVVTIQILLAAVDRFPLRLSLFSIASHGVYSLNLRRFPVVKLTEPVFLASCALVLLNHWLWFRHFSNPPTTTFGSPGRYSYYETRDMPTFTEIASFFGLNVWLVPFALFVSLSAGENVLPSMGSEYATGQGSSFISPGRDAAPTASMSGMNGGMGQTRTRHKRSNTQTGMAKQAVNGVRDWVGETGELMGFWKGERTRPL
ncbi:Protein SVP26 [Pseudocercospora fuligena]|uniref:Protein SVP26 n=1 Tax=Pseudocercospora fuligena TaxID=685502 RepID=A0A8H6RA30_9PEZI|nr:Protein SVP26 [Pseudocercospora fuligena]